MHPQLQALLSVYNSQDSDQAVAWFVDLGGADGQLESLGPVDYRTACHISGMMMPLRSVTEISLRRATAALIPILPARESASRQG